MHKNSMKEMQRFFDKYVVFRERKHFVHILDVGSRKARRRDQCYKDLLSMSVNALYTGLDLLPGPNVDIVSPNRYDYPFESNHFDVVISGQTMEHVENPFPWISELKRVLKPGGLLCVIAPSAGPRHQDYDYWRILPDGMRALFAHVDLEILEIKQCENSPWRDVVGIARKGWRSG